MTEHEQYIFDNYIGNNAQAIAEKLGIKKTRVFYLASKIGKTSNKITSWSKTKENEKEILELYKQKNTSISYIADKYRASWDSVKELILENGLPLKKKGHIIPRKHKVNESFFEDINSPEKAYWLGFIAADGSIIDNCLSIGLAIKDKAHLELFKKRIEFSGDISTTFSMARIRICSVKMINDLRNHGIVKRKTVKLDERILSKIERKFHRHFIHGYIDGDGSVTMGKDSGLYINICGDKELLEEIRVSFAEDSGIFFSEPRQSKKTHFLYYISLRVNEKRLPIVNDYFFKDGSEDFLERKRKPFIIKSSIYEAEHYPPKTHLYIRNREINKLRRIISSAQNALEKLLAEEPLQSHENK